jgi:hypothetical protein
MKITTGQDCQRCSISCSLSCNLPGDFADDFPEGEVYLYGPGSECVAHPESREHLPN